MQTDQSVNIFILAIRTTLPWLILLMLPACGGGGSESNNGASNGGSVVLQAITITPTNSTLVFGRTLQLVATGTYSDGTTRDISSSVTWASTKSSMIELSASGLVTAVTTGTSTVVAMSVTGTVQGSTTVVVIPGTATESILHAFFGPRASDGLQPSDLIQASDGNFYGTTMGGGNNTCSSVDGPVGCGTVFKLTPDGVETVLYSFGASASDAWWPISLMQSSDGNFYGTSISGGTNGVGTVFKLSLEGIETVLYSFGASPADGVTPQGKLILASDGNFYGTTASGGSNYCSEIPGNANNCGTVFKITPTGVETILHSFGASTSDGVEPLGSVIQSSDGNFYGTTSGGGANGCLDISGNPGIHNCGTVFKLTPAGNETILYSFGASPADGYGPQGQLIQASDGNLYGTTAGGGGLPCLGANGCGGTVFQLTLNGNESVLYRFISGPADEGSPSPILLEGSDGNFYGTTVDGGPYNTPGGTVYRLTPNGVETILYSFAASESDGVRPVFLLQASDANFYGVTDTGGGVQVIGAATVDGGGTVFKLVP